MLPAVRGTGLALGWRMAWARRMPERTVLYEVVRENLETFIAMTEARDPEGRGVLEYVRGSLRRYLDCGIIQKGFARVRCADCGHDAVVGFS